MESDQTLLARFVEGGDRAALGELVRRHQDGVYDFVRRRIGDATLAEDITQEAFVRAMGSAGKFRGSGTVKAWLYGIAVNGARMALRARARARAREAASAPPDPPPSSPERSAVLADVRAAVDALPEPMQTPVVLHFFRGLTHAEVADALGCPKGTVASRIHDAKQLLRGALATVVAGVALDDLLAESAFAAACPASLVMRLGEAVEQAIPPIAAAASGVGIGLAGQGLLQGALMSKRLVLAALVVLGIAGFGGLVAWDLFGDGLSAGALDAPETPAVVQAEPEGAGAEHAASERAAERAATATPESTPLTGPVTLAGRVVDAAGNGVAGARVSAGAATGRPPEWDGAYWVEWRAGDATPLTTVRSGPDGAFEVHGLPAGRAWLTAVAPDGRTAEWCGDRRAGTQRVELQVRAAAAVEGLVLDAHGWPLAGVPVTAVRAAEWVVGNSRRTAPCRHATITGTDGRFVIRPVAPARYRVTVEWLARPAAERTVWAGAPTVFRAESGADVTGRVTAGAAPVAGARIELRCEDGSSPASISFSPGDLSLQRAVAHADADGRFRLAGVPLGRRYTLHATADGFTPAYVSAAPLLDADGAQADLVMLPGASLRGQVVDGDAPVAGATVTAYRGERTLPEWAGRTGADGRFSIEALFPGAYRLQVRAPGYTAAVWPDADPIGLKAGEQRAGLTVPVGGVPVTTGVVRTPSGTPVPGARVHIEIRPVTPSPQAAYGSATVVSDEDGRFAVRGPRWAGAARCSVRWTVVADATGHAAGETPLPVTLPAELELVIGHAGRRVSGVVQDTAGRPVAFARVILVTHPTLGERMGDEFGSGESFWGDVSFPATAREAGVGAVADAAGRFELRAGNGERFSVVAARPGKQTWARTVVRLRPEEHREGVTVELPATRTVAGRIRSIDGSALEGIVVNGGGRPVTSSRDGRFQLDVPADTETLRVTDSSRRFVQGSITLPEGTAPARGLELQLAPAATIVLEVSPAPGTALPAELRVSHLAGRTWHSRRTRCPRDGRIVLRGVDASVAHEFELRPEGGAEVTVRAEKLVAGGLTRVPVVLASGRVIQGLVVDAAGLPVAGARVSTWAGTMNALSLRAFRMQRRADEVYTAVDGRFSLVLERATVDTVFVGHPDYIGAHTKVSDDAAPVRVVLQRGGGIEGTLVRDGRATAQSIVRAQRVGGGYGRSDHTRVDGGWRITGLPPGEYRVTTGSGEAELVANVTVAAGGVARVDLK